MNKKIAILATIAIFLAAIPISSTLASATAQQENPQNSCVCDSLQTRDRLQLRQCELIQSRTCLQGFSGGWAANGNEQGLAATLMNAIQNRAQVGIATGK